MPKPQVRIDQRALKKVVEGRTADLNATIDKEIKRRKPTDRAGVEKIVKTANSRSKGLELDRAAEKAIVDRLVDQLGL